MVHCHSLSEVLGQRSAVEAEWTWLPEVVFVENHLAVPLAPATETELESAPEEEPATEPAEESAAELPPSPELGVEECVEMQPEPAPQEAPEDREECASLEASSSEPTEMAPGQIHDAWAVVRAAILGELRYPALARQRQIEGVAVVWLRLDEAGAIVSVKIRPPEPSPLICDAVVRAVRRAGPFPEAGDAIRKGTIPATAEMARRFNLGMGERR